MDEKPQDELPEEDRQTDVEIQDEELEGELVQDENFEDDEDAFSLEELGAAYQHIVAQSESDDGGPAISTGEVLQREQLLAAQAKAKADADALAAEAETEHEGDDEDIDWDADGLAADSRSVEETATPEAIIEAALFVGQPSGEPVSATRLASIMRDMTPDEVTEIIQRLNASYRELRQGIRIAQDDVGFRMIVAPEAESMRHVFTGKVRETRLNQSSIEVLSLVAYQPGITAQQCTDLRGRDSGSLLNQMVRRRLIEMKREPEQRDPPERNTADDGDSDANPDRKKAKPKPKLVSRYYPAERLLVLLGLESLEDLPQVEETHLE
ncbi:SMC-Scp complex subunit ScpB [Neorhodopirellula pilleata]|uniref:Segregation and condensation protein B n=1 Tax=Neorhodopirellula pilleata TaxID=2714738 RepID=A0A5C6A6W6_9BACT|nr:SMC-Scp complex subunit ScpB [Neorhodopirellula pilleata]TWT95107.1 segregation and condensation protein B [Neorhodopirellula pilleata]